MTINDIYYKALSILNNANTDDADFDCICIFEKAFGFGKTQLLINPEMIANEECAELFIGMIQKRAIGIPLQYILGEWDFYDMTFFVGEGVLIPRPETEMLCELAFKFLKKKRNAVVFDLCSGSGCIGLTVAAHYPDCRVFLVDISDKALRYSDKSRIKYNLKNVCIIKYDIFKGYNEDVFKAKPDLILANPPYIQRDEIKFLQKEVHYEPVNALDGGDDGLDFYRILSSEWLPALKSGGEAAVECGEEQPGEIVKLFSNELSNIKTAKDCYGVERFVLGERRD